MIPLVVIVGPTASGKTDLSIRLAERLQGEIVSADSRLFYRGMDIGTAKPSPEERARAPHHLIDVADPDETWSLAAFQQAAHAVIADIHACGKVPFLVGGTGQYIRAVTHGWCPPAVAPWPRLRSVLERLAGQHSPFWLHEKLALLDPTAAGAIDPRNLRRTIRAFEVIFATGYPFSAQRRRIAPRYALLTIGLHWPRPTLYERIDARIENMFAQGLLEETQRLLARGYSPDLPPLSAIGYRQCIAVLRNELTLEQAKAEMRRLTRAFVRRQDNWFRRTDPNIRWFNAESTPLEEIEAAIQAFLSDQGRLTPRESPVRERRMG